MPTEAETLRVRIHRGANEIGGNCIEVAATTGERLTLDLGRPLSAGWNDTIELPPVEGLQEFDAGLLALIVSHPHLDHYGLVKQVKSSVPIFMGREAAAIVNAASFFSPAGAPIAPTGFLEHECPFAIGPFTITPHLNDHSAFDAYSILIEADGRRLFYTGDLRAHGRKAALFERFVADPPRGIDAVLMEGTHVRPDAAHDDAVFDTEHDLEEELVRLCNATAGAVVVFGSAQNIDRLVTAYRGARRSGREFVVDLYGATVAGATRATIPQPGFPVLRVLVPQLQRVRMKQSDEFERVAAIKSVRIFLEELAAHPERFVLHVPSSAAAELLKSGVLDERGLVLWSLWAGYLKDAGSKAMLAELADANVPFRHLHTSGHASVADLRRLVVALNPARVIPIHSESTDRFAELFPRVERHEDGEWWSV